jgi:glyoxylase-like metal-dependent hydrolase (beta-lactamase superfamily II)
MINIETLSVGPMANCAYLVTKDNDALLIDPAWDIDKIEQLLQNKKYTLCGVLFTHGHFDHVKSAQTLLEKHHLKGYLHEKDILLSGLDPVVLSTYSGDKNLTIGPFSIEILETPGHTEGCVCIRIEDALFTGDTLFPGACGRVDLPTSNPRSMRDSLLRLSALPGDIRIFAGHSYGGNSTSTIAQEKQHNPFMRNAMRNEAL